MKNGIIIPCYNEEKRLDLEAFSQFITAHKDYVLCFVNDGSTDNTLVALRLFEKTNPSQIKVYNMPQNSGKAEAVRSGIHYLLKLESLETIGFIDADLSTDFIDYKQLVSKLICCPDRTMSFGSRKAASNHNIQRSLFRSLMSWIIGFMIRSILHLPISDTQCGAKVFRADIAGYCFRDVFISKWLFDVEIFIRLKRLYGKKKIMNFIKEIPLKNWMDVEGSKLGIRDSIEIPSQLLKIAYDYNIQSIRNRPEVSKPALAA